MTFPKSLNQFRKAIMRESMRRALIETQKEDPIDELFITLHELNNYLEMFNAANSLCKICHNFHGKGEACR